MCNFQTFGCSNESSPNSSSHFWNHTTRSGFIQILHHRSVSWKISPLYFFSSNIIHFGQKQPIEVKFVGFWVFGWKFTKFLMSNLKVNRQVSFSLNFASLFNVIGDSLLYLFSWNIIWFLPKEPTTVQNFRLLTAQVKFHQIWTLIRYFCWKYVCVCVFTSIHLEGFICLGLEVEGTDQRCCAEDVIFLCQVPSSILQYESPSLSN